MSRPISLRVASAALPLPLVAALALCADGDPDRPSYNRDVRPILAEACFACHGPDGAARQADLRLDRAADARAAGAVVPGDPAGSSLVARIFAEDPDDVMPPPKTRKILTAEEKETLRRWIEAGAEYEAHWSFLPPRRTEPPATSRPEWARDPMDAFILAKIEAAGLSPSPEAERGEWARRASFDIIGLPPPVAVLDEFLADDSPEAYERFADRLLASPSWGEHRAHYWLDYARYADTHGIHFDNYREMWSYREWVIRAFNDGMPFDRFTIENLAGDLLPEATLDQRVASGFNRCNMTTNEGGIIDEEYRVLYARDRTETTVAVWLGLTANCSVCHDHKFDPLSQRDFYSLSAFFNNTTQPVRDGNVADTPPVEFVPLREDRERWRELPEEIALATAARDARRQGARGEFDAWLAAGAAADEPAETVPAETVPAGIVPPHLFAALRGPSGAGTTILRRGPDEVDVALAPSATWVDGPSSGAALQPEGSAFVVPDAGDFERDEPFSVSAWVKMPADIRWGAICARMDDTQAHRGWDFWAQGRRIGMHIVESWPESGLKVVARRELPVGVWTHVTVTYDGTSRAAGVSVYYDGERQETSFEKDDLRGSIRTAVPFRVGSRHTSEPLSGVALQGLRLEHRLLGPDEIRSNAGRERRAAILAKAPADRTAEEIDALFSWWLPSTDAAYRELAASVERLEGERSAVRARGTIAHVMNERDGPAMANILYRGEYDKRRDEMRADTPLSLPPFSEEWPRNRLGLAKWLLSEENPLTARVTVNRFWQEVFGVGIVRTASDFGVAGELPSHPELLDNLALDFRRSGFDIKGLIRRFILSATYRQSAAATAEAILVDPSNRLLARAPRFRLDAEMVRDTTLAASGLLVGRIGGPSVKPYQPPGVWEAIAMNVSNTRSYVPGTGPDLYRRSVYTFIKRMAPPASLEVFGAPNREFCVITRERTNTPLQALAALNDEQYVEAARRLAERALCAASELEGRLAYVTRRLLSRDFEPAEVDIVRASLERLRAHYEEHPDGAAALLAVGESTADPSIPGAELAAWTLVVNQLFNLDEVLNK